ncbi:hypothetical protein [Hymenobacter wooponensis]|uniref:Uncharacterized protein n=1 Tax=Hymenobacter wooponensis TaxID=1525360 RepID=A0A4Z0MDG1_9BACT|nr:hypothetical protein [Hymenobacter wooponensis]TGD77566.1 hypothetical protein EU557_22570 [Hymenobacter wooponensis]
MKKNLRVSFGLALGLGRGGSWAWVPATAQQLPQFRSAKSIIRPPRHLTLHIGFARPRELAKAAHKTYRGAGPRPLVAGQQGAPSHTDEQWLGFFCPDLLATLDLEPVATINSVKSTFLQAAGSGIRLPARVEVAGLTRSPPRPDLFESR